MAENIAKIDEKIRELKRKKKTAENQQMIKACNAYLRSLNSSLKESGIQVKRIDEVLGFLLEQEANGKWCQRPPKLNSSFLRIGEISITNSGSISFFRSHFLYSSGLFASSLAGICF